jgi:DNA-binding transcriptional ArsR family regulator
MKLSRENMKYTVIAPMGDYMDAIFVGLREFPTEKIILISPEKKREEAMIVKSELEKYHVPTHILSIKGTTEIEIWESTFKAIGNLSSNKIGSDFLVNVATGDSISSCAATTAAFVNGLKAFTIYNNKITILPLLKFSYYKIIPDKKMEILKLLNNEEYCSSLEELGKKTQMSLPLISYHINGNLRSEGLKNMGLVETIEDKNKIAIELSTLGRMIAGGYISS